MGVDWSVAGDQWPLFLYANYAYDAEDPWNRLLRSGLLVLVRLLTVVWLMVFLPQL